MNGVDRLCDICHVTIVACTVALVMMKYLKCKKKSHRSVWSKDILLRRNKEGVHALLIPRLLSDSFLYVNYFRMTKETFVELLNLVEPGLQRHNTNLRRCISTSERLALTLRFLATGKPTNFNVC